MKKGLIGIVVACMVLMSGISHVLGSPDSGRKSFSGSGFENINLYNGRFNFLLPLLSIQSRGSTQTTIPLSINPTVVRDYIHSEPVYQTVTTPQQDYVCNFHMSYVSASSMGRTEVETTPVYDDCFSTGSFGTQQYIRDDLYDIFFLDYEKWSDSGYGPGLMYGINDVRNTTTYGVLAPHANIPNAGTSRTVLYLNLPGGGSHQFVDQQTLGRYKYWNVVDSSIQTFNRGTNFVSTDGTSMTFVSDTAIYDTSRNQYNVGPSDPPHFYPSGIILMPDGSRYRIDQGVVTYIQDKDGNRTSFEYLTESNYAAYRHVSKITDSFGREINFAYDVDDQSIGPDGNPYGLRDEISFSGFGGSNQKIFITKTDLGNDLRSDFQLKQIQDLWDFPFNNRTSYFTKQVVSSVWMADGTRYRFQYDNYGDLSRVEFPEGNATEYDHDYLSNATVNGHIINGKSTMRRISAKREYSDSLNAGSISTTTTFSSIYLPTDLAVTPRLTTIPVEVKVTDSQGTLKFFPNITSTEIQGTDRTQIVFKQRTGLNFLLQGRSIRLRSLIRLPSLFILELNENGVGV